MDHFREVADRLQGPLVPLMIPFKEDDSIDWDALGKFVNWVVEQGVPMMWLTPGTSQYYILTGQEIRDLTRCIAEANAGRAVFIASTKPWPAHECIDFVDYCREVGADAVKVIVDWGRGPGEDELFEFYRQIAEATNFPLLAYSLGVPGLSPALAARLAELPQLIGLKNDTNDHEGHAAYLQACGPGFVPITGGMMRPIFWGWDFGARAFADIFTLFRPEISLAFFHHMQRGELAEAAAIMHNYEDVLYPAFRQLGNFKSCAKAGLWLTGHYPTARMRLPFRAASPEEILKVREVLERLEIPVVVSP